MSKTKKIANLKNEMYEIINDTNAEVKARLKECMEICEIKSFRLTSESNYNDNNYYTSYQIAEINEFSLLETGSYFYDELVQEKINSKLLKCITSKKQAELIIVSCCSENIDEAIERKDLFDSEKFDEIIENEPYENSHLSHLQVAALCYYLNIHLETLREFMIIALNLPEALTYEFMD